MKTLELLGMNKNWLYEIIVSIYRDSLPHAAPFGVRTKDFKTIALEMYKGSGTLQRILESEEFAVNTVEDPIVMYNVLYCKERIFFEKAQKINCPVLSNSQSNIEVRLTSTTEKEKSYLLEAEVVHVRTRKDGEMINRAKGLVLESLILSTRRSLIPSQELEKMLRENYRVINKVAPDSKYLETMKSLMADCLNYEGSRGEKPLGK